MNDRILTEGVPRIDLDTLPSLAELFGGALNTMWRRDLGSVLASTQDTSTEPQAELSIAYAISFVPDADRRSTSYQLARHTTKIPGQRAPATSRMTFMHNSGALEIYDRSPPQSTSLGEPARTFAGLQADRLPGLERLFGGSFDERWKRCLISIILNIDDPSTSPQAKRSFVMEVGFKADEDRQSVLYRLKKCHAKTAPPKSPDPSRMYLDADPDGLMRCDLTDLHPAQANFIDDDVSTAN